MKDTMEKIARLIHFIIPGEPQELTFQELRVMAAFGAGKAEYLYIEYVLNNEWPPRYEINWNEKKKELMQMGVIFEE